MYALIFIILSFCIFLYCCFIQLGLTDNSHKLTVNDIIFAFLVGLSLTIARILY